MPTNLQMMVMTKPLEGTGSIEQALASLPLLTLITPMPVKLPLTS